MDSRKDMDSSNPNPFGTEETFFSAFMAMNDMVEEMYEDRKCYNFRSYSYLLQHSLTIACNRITER